MFGFFRKKQQNADSKTIITSDEVKLNNDYKVPRIAINLDGVPKESITNYINCAIKCGYRFFDFHYENENLTEIASALKNSGIPRNKYFLSVSIDCPPSPKKIDPVVDDLLKKLETNYIDIGIFKAKGFAGVILEIYYHFYKVYSEKHKFKAFGIEDLSDMREDIFNMYRSLKIQIEKIPTNLLQPNYVLKNKYDRKGIIIEATKTLEIGDTMINYLRHDLTPIAEKYNKSISQLVLRYLYQNNEIVTVKPTNLNEMQEYIDIKNFNIADEDIKFMERLDNNN